VLGLKDRVANVVYHGAPAEMLDSFGVRNQADLFDKLQQFSGASPAEREAAERDAQADAEQASSVVRRRRRDVLQVPRLAITPQRMWQQAQVVFRRTFLGLLRDKMSMFMALAQPLILVILVTLGLANQLKSMAVLFFTVICMMWLGMTLTVREVVRERKLYIRDRIAGMHPDAYLLGKMLFAAGVVTVQATIMWWFVRLISPALVRDDMGENLRRGTFLLGWFVMIVTGLGAAILGLLMSTISKSERAAITLLPLLLLPQVVLSRTVYGDIRKDWRDPSAYLAMYDFITAKPMAGEPKAFKQQQQQMQAMKALYDEYDKQPEQIKALFVQQYPALKDMEKPQLPPAFKEPTWAGRSLNFMLSALMLTRPAAASLDMLCDWNNEDHPERRASAPMVFTEILYLLVLVAAYGGLTYFLFRKLERGWNDIRSA
jgi:hypothetical protein